MTANKSLTLEQIQGRLNQRELPWRAAPVSGGGSAVMFTPNGGGGVSVVWDRDQPAAKSLDEIAEFLASYK